MSNAAYHSKLLTFKSWLENSEREGFSDQFNLWLLSEGAPTLAEDSTYGAHVWALVGVYEDYLDSVEYSKEIGSPAPAKPQIPTDVLERALAFVKDELHD